MLSARTEAQAIDAVHFWVAITARTDGEVSRWRRVGRLASVSQNLGTQWEGVLNVFITDPLKKLTDSTSEVPFVTDTSSESLPSGTQRRRGRRRMTLAAAIAAMATVPVLLPINLAYADPSADQWAALRECESSGNYSINTGNGYYGAYQFDLSTWESVGGAGYPHQASSQEQDARALMLYRMRGWQPWTCADKLGFTDDADAKTGITSDISIDTGGSSAPAAPPTAPAQPAPASAPAFPGQLNYGQYSESLKQWQAQMAARGANIPATGYFGDITKGLALTIQAQNGFDQVGWIGPLTWSAAWTGGYTP